MQLKHRELIATQYVRAQDLEPWRSGRIFGYLGDGNSEPCCGNHVLLFCVSSNNTLSEASLKILHLGKQAPLEVDCKL
ncbi:Layilin [Manis pentadactyla]|nr:Layilin [Manis pentadactyla]